MIELFVAKERRTYKSARARLTSKMVHPSGLLTVRKVNPSASWKLTVSTAGQVTKAQDAFGCEQRGPYCEVLLSGKVGRCVRRMDIVSGTGTKAVVSPGDSWLQCR